MRRMHYDIPENGPPFHARVVLEEGRSVRVWSKEHIPLSPTGAARKLREQLRDHLPGLRAENSSQYLCAEYGVRTAPDGNRAVIQADVENNLFYNVGIGAFAPSARFGIRFQKVASFNHEHFPEAGYYYAYTLIPSGVAPWRAAPPAWVRRVPYPHHVYHKDWSTIWLAIKDETARFSAVKPIGKAAFALSVELSPPENAGNVNLVGLLKPIFDGVICALHHDDSLETAEAMNAVTWALQERIYKKARREVTLADLKKHLLGKHSSLLGETRFVRPYQYGCKCYPWDHLCVAGELVLLPAEGAGWEMTASVFQV